MISKLKNISKFYDQVKQEAVRVTWPTRSELLTSTYIVMISVFVFSLVFLLIDYGIHSIIQLLLGLGN